MGDGDRDRGRETLTKARMELEELYLGIPDDSVNLTFQDLANVQQHHHNPSETKEKMAAKKKKSKKEDKPPSTTTNTLLVLDPIFEGPNTPSHNNTATHADGDDLISGSPFQRHDMVVMNKVPSLDFSRGLRGTSCHHHHPLDHYDDQAGKVNGDGLNHMMIDDSSYASSGGHHRHNNMHAHHQYHHSSTQGRPHNSNNVMNSYNSYDVHDDDHANVRRAVSSMAAYEDVSMYSNYSRAERSVAGAGAGAARFRRPGIPHSNICTVCTTYIYIFRHRCLVCGRVYCRQCVSTGMGEMTEGRKCIECLGRRFSLRYIHKAGKVGCFRFGYGSKVKQAELKWAEKGPRRSGEMRGRHGHGRSGNVSPMISMSSRSRSRSPIGGAAPSPGLHQDPYSVSVMSQHNIGGNAKSSGMIGSNNPPSFVVGSPYSPASHHHYLPF